MATTQIKRLFQNNTEFVPITLSEAVVVNTDKYERDQVNAKQDKSAQDTLPC